MLKMFSEEENTVDESDQEDDTTSLYESTSDNKTSNDTHRTYRKKNKK